MFKSIVRKGLVGTETTFIFRNWNIRYSNNAQKRSRHSASTERAKTFDEKRQEYFSFKSYVKLVIPEFLTHSVPTLPRMIVPDTPIFVAQELP